MKIFDNGSGELFQKHFKKTSLVKYISKVDKKDTEAVDQNAVFINFVKYTGKQLRWRLCSSKIVG